MSTIQLTSEAQPLSTAARPPSRAAGLYAAPKGHMTPCFGLLTLFLVLDVASFVVPFYVTRFTESSWGSADRMGFLARAMASALAFGLVSAIAAERRNHTSWWFLLGHAGFPLALAFSFAGFDVPFAGPERDFLDPRGPVGAAATVIATGFLGTAITLIATRKPRPSLGPMNALQARICRLMFRWGNIWFGIAMMVAIGVTVAAGTLLENRYGTKSAQYLVYRSPWFGAIFFAGGTAMLCATFRKYPFRLEQAGWLTVHSGLAMVVIGGMTSFLSSVDGEATIREGETAETFKLSTQTRLALDEIVMRPNGTPTNLQRLRAIADFDVNPTVTEPNRAYDLSTGDGEPAVRVVVDRYFALGEAYSRWSDDGHGDHVGLELELFMGRAARPERIRLDQENENRTSIPFGEAGFDISLFRATPRLVDALLRTSAAPGFGNIVVTDGSGKEVLAVPVEPAAGERVGGRPAPLKKSMKIPGTEIEARLVAYYDNIQPARTRGAFQDASPGNPVNPAVTLEIAGPQGTDTHAVLAYLGDEADPPSDARKYPYRLSYACEPRIEMQGPELLFADVEGRISWIFVSSSGQRTSGEVTAGADLPLPMPAFRIRTAALYRRLRIENGYEFKGYKAEQQVIRVSVTAADGTAAAPIWLPLGSKRTFALGDRNLTMSWAPTVRPLGFSLKLNRFHRDFYPGTKEESSFESYCALRHAAKFPAGEDIKIDMNHPLRLDGWRLFQSRFGGDGHTTILQINRDPGLILTYPACAVVLLGLIVVFFMKKTLRQKRAELELRKAPPGRHLAWAIGSVAAVGVGPLLFGLYAATHERLGLPLSGWPSFVFGVTLLIAAPITVVWAYVSPFSRRLTAVLSAPPPMRASP